LNKQLFRPALLAAVMVTATALPACWGQSITASIAKPKIGYVRINEPVVVDFSQKIDVKSVRVAVDPTADFTIDAKSKQVMVTPTKGWKPSQTYSLSVNSVSNSDHSLSLSNWKGSFKTQPRVGIAGYLIDGKPVATTGGTPVLGAYSRVTVTFTAPMKIETATPTLNGNPVLAGQFSWASDGKSVDYAPGWVPYQTYKFGIAGQPVTQEGDVASDLPDLSAGVLGWEPSNSTSQIGAEYQTQAPMLIVEDNAEPARPQYGLQSADIVFEYISEYNISRFTLVYFNHPAAQIGPVRSCRMINTYLVEALQGVQMCSGASDGTLHYLWGNGTPQLPKLPVDINDYDTGDHFFRVNSKPAPHNLFTDASRVERLRAESKAAGGPYVVDPSHSDIAAGNFADPPIVPLQGVAYSYEAGSCQCYRPVDHGTARIDAQNGGNQLAVKNVVFMHVPYHAAGWVEDVNGGAQSIWYDMNGSGPAEVWSDGRLVHATWHQGAAGQSYYQNTTQPVIFTDESGALLRLNTGLTWVHVVGNGQTS
jgi:Protein of unknown function (DUF3048) N-terminal domain/Protein of unknown function (DUF3048) C-terminal domain